MVPAALAALVVPPAVRTNVPAFALLALITPSPVLAITTRHGARAVGINVEISFWRPLGFASLRDSESFHLPNIVRPHQRRAIGGRLA